MPAARSPPPGPRRGTSARPGPRPRTRRPPRRRPTGAARALWAPAALVKAAEAEAAAISAELDQPERDALRQAFGEGSTGKGVAKAVRGAAGALKDLDDRQKSRATRLKR